jgi:two-component system, cell cycle sensor histidine kinase and response regulator CckA
LWKRAVSPALTLVDTSGVTMTTLEFDQATAEELRTAYTASEARFEALFQNAADVTVLVTAEGKVLHVSASVERVLGHRPADLIGRRALDFIDPEDDPIQRRFLAEAVATPGATRGEPLRALHADGTWRTVEPVGLNLLDDPAVAGLVITLRDVSERGELEARIRQMERLEAVGQLAGGIAHDFNNILLVVRGYSSVLRSALGDSELVADVDEIAKAADRAADLTRQLLAFAGRQVLRPALVDLREIVHGIETLLRRSVPEDIEMAFDLDHEIGVVLADPAQIEQVLLNLVVNARDATPAGGRIVVSMAPVVLEPAAEVSPPAAPGPYVALTVTDTGSGISDADLPYIFEPFFTTKADGIGTGLGLSTVYGIVAQSGGAIEVAARPGTGTRMTVYLPSLDGAPESDAEAAPALRLPVGNETILLVEDEDAVRDLVCRVLENAGYTVLSAARPSEAQRLAIDAKIDLLLTDVVMPEMSGYDLAVRIRLGHPEAHTLFISGYAHKAMGEAPHLPEGELLRKPFSPEQLTRAVRAVLDGETLEPQ